MPDRPEAQGASDATNDVVHIRVRHGGGQRHEAGWCDQDAGGEQSLVKCSHLLTCFPAGIGGPIIPQLPGGEMHASQRCPPGDLAVTTHIRQRLGDTARDLFATPRQCHVRILCHQLHGHKASDHGHRVRIECATVRHDGLAAGRIKHPHDIRPAADRPHRQAATDDLAQGREISAEAKRFLCSTPGDPERNHLVTDQDNSERVTQPSDQ